MCNNEDSTWGYGGVNLHPFVYMCAVGGCLYLDSLRSLCLAMLFCSVILRVISAPFEIGFTSKRARLSFVERAQSEYKTRPASFDQTPESPASAVGTRSQAQVLLGTAWNFPVVAH